MGELVASACLRVHAEESTDPPSPGDIVLSLASFAPLLPGVLGGLGSIPPRQPSGDVDGECGVMITSKSGPTRVLVITWASRCAGVHVEA